MSFHGSYRPQDVEFLLKPITFAPIDVVAKEHLIQSGKRHYSEMLSQENLPSVVYRSLFDAAFQRNRQRMARDCLRLAAHVGEKHGKNVALVSLARAGTPIGAIVRHLVERIYAGCPTHYSVSIIRDRGIDAVALDTILGRGHAPHSIAIIDGWTGKGVISHETRKAVQAYNASRKVRIASGLVVLSDLAGTAAWAASDEDYLIPSSILNSTISGLISRSILNEMIGADDYHGCVYYKEFEAHDLSQWFVDEIVADALALYETEGISSSLVDPSVQAARSTLYLKEEMERHNIRDINLIKPGIGEATRVLLRRVPERILLRNKEADDVAHLVSLAHEKNVVMEVRPDLPYHAVSIIRSALNA